MSDELTDTQKIEMLTAACFDALDRLVKISNLLNGGTTPDDIREAYNTAYAGAQRRALEVCAEE